MSCFSDWLTVTISELVRQGLVVTDVLFCLIASRQAGKQASRQAGKQLQSRCKLRLSVLYVSHGSEASAHIVMCVVQAPRILNVVSRPVTLPLSQNIQDGRR